MNAPVFPAQTVRARRGSYRLSLPGPLRVLGLPLAIAGLSLLPAQAFATQMLPGGASLASTAGPRVVYAWNPASFKPAPGNPWSAEQVTRGDGTVAASISSTGAGWNNYLFVPPGRLKSGGKYTALLRYEIAVPAKFPDSFYIFARSKKLGQARDVWCNFNGDAGKKGTARMALTLPEADDWVLYGGCKGPGTLIIDSFQVVEGNGLAYLPPVPGGGERATPGQKSKDPTGAGTVLVDTPRPAGNLVLRAADFGLKPEAPGTPATGEEQAANFAALNKALAASKEQKAARLVLEPGTYRLAGRGSIVLDGLTDFVLDGQDAELVFARLNSVEAISVARCSRVVLKDFKVDWDWGVTPIASLAVPQSVSPDGLSCELEFPEASPAELAGIVKAPWTHLLGVDPDTLVRSNFERFSLAVAQKEQSGPRAVKVTFKGPVPLVAGQSYTLRHLYYEMPAFKVSSSNHLLCDGVTIYSIPGMGWVGTADIHHWKLVNCRIVRRPGTRRPLTTAADGFHITQSQGHIALENCEFSGSGDDSINIHDNCFQGVERVAERTLRLVNCPKWRIRLNPGDAISLYAGDYAPLGWQGKVLEVAYPGNDSVVTLDRDLPAGLSPFSIVRNLRYNTANVRISNCRFHDTGGRAILLSAKNATVENCVFENSVGTAIQLHTEIVGNLWAEGDGARNVVIRGNTFRGTSYEGRYDNAIIYSGAKLPTGVTSYPLFQDILIEGNRFFAGSGPAAMLTCARGVTVRGNTIQGPDRAGTANEWAGALWVAHASGLDLRGNQWQVPRSRGAGLFRDTLTAQDILY